MRTCFVDTTPHLHRQAPNPEFYERKLEQAAEYIRLLSAQVSELSQRACQYEEYIAEIRLDKLRSHDDPGDPETMTDPHDVNLVLLNSGEFGWGDLATHKGEEQQHHIADLKEIAHEVDGPSEAQIRNSNVEDILRGDLYSYALLLIRSLNSRR